MSDELKEQENEEENKGPSEMSQVLEALRALKEEPKEEAPKPAAPKAPPAPSGRVTKAEYEALQQYAAEQRQRAERLELAQEFGITAGDLEGDFESPADMKRHAEVLALRIHLADLETQLKEVRTKGEGPPAIPDVDTGGPTSNEDSRVEELRKQYTEARAGGRTDRARRALLTAIYRDPTKRSRVFNRE